MQNKHVVTPVLSNNIKFLIACCQVEPSEDDITFIYSYINDEHFNFNTLIALANQHAIIPLVYKTLSTIKNTPPPLLSALKTHDMHTVKKNMLMSVELIGIMKLLEEHDIEALAFKGPTLAQLAYGDITLRQYVDIDILVNADDAYSVGKLMKENGHDHILPLSILFNKTCLHLAKDFSLISQCGVHTELHWRLFEKKYNIFLLSCVNETTCQTVSINGNAIKTLQNELLLVYLCLHGAKHAFERIEWICDIDRLIRTSEVDWDTAISLAEKSHSKRSFYLGLSLTKTLFHTNIPSCDNMLSDNIIRLQTMLLSQLSQKKKIRSEFKNNIKIFFYHSKLFDTKSDIVQFYISVFFKISTSDCQTFILPQNLKFLYIILKPLRLIWSYGQKVINR